MNREELKGYFKNITQGRSTITQIIQNTPFDKQFRNKEIEALLAYHPHEGKIGEIEYLIVKRNEYNGRSLYFLNKGSVTEDDSSYVACIRNLFGKFDIQKDKMDRIITAFRDTISSTTKKTYYLEHRFDCCFECGQDYNLAVDHFMIAFQQILDEFIADSNIRVSKLQVKEIRRNIWDFVDADELRESWIRYHDGRATFRMLCKKCNGKCGAYGYKTRTELYV
jgi:hypothetical protein